MSTALPQKTLVQSPPLVTQPSLLSRLLFDQRAAAAIFLVPAIVVLLFVVVYPFFNAIWLSFHDKMPGAPAKYIALKNYYELFGDPVFLRVIRNTIFYTVLGVTLKFCLGLVMALVLSQERPLNYIYKTILFVPWAVPTLVAALTWRWLYNDFSGLFNAILNQWFGFAEPFPWLGDRNYTMYAVVAVVVWSGTPFYTMSFLAGLKAVPNELYEAATLDGASRVQSFWYVTLPQMRSVFTVVIMLSAIWTSTQVVIVQILTNGGPANATQIVPNLAYKYALFLSRLGIGSATNMVFFPILAVLIYFISRRMLAERFRD